MKDELQKLIEVDTTLGEITPETSKHAAETAAATGQVAVAAYVISCISLAIGAATLLAGCNSVGAGGVVAGLMFLYAARYCMKESEKYDAIHLAYMQRHRLRELRGDDVLAALPEPKKKRR